MPSIVVVDDEQARIIDQSSDLVELRDRHGKRLGYVSHGFSAEDIALALQRKQSQEPRHTMQEVLSRIQKLAQP